MLRTAVLIVSSLITALGVFLYLKGVPAYGALLGGLIVLVGTLFERWRYRHGLPHAAAEPSSIARHRQAPISVAAGSAVEGGHWQTTGERFIDPQSGKEVEVLYDPESGERRYRYVG